MSFSIRIPFKNNRFNRTRYYTDEEKEKLLNFRNRKRVAVKKWRSRAWSIDPRETRLIIKTESPNMENIDDAISVLESASQLLENYSQFFEAIEDMEQFCQP